MNNPKEIIFLINPDIYKLVFEYIKSIKNTIFDSKIIIYQQGDNIFYNKNNIYIFVGIMFVDYIIINEPNVYYINIEQMTIPERLKFGLNFKDKKCKLLDYSETNCNILRKHNIQTLYLPYQVNLAEVFNYKKIYDFVICCSWNEKIENIFAPLSKKFSNSHRIGKPVLYGNTRDNILLRSKVLINIHNAKDYLVLEEIRITRCILNKVIVISEKSLEEEKYPLIEYVISCDYDNLVNKATEILNNYDYYYNLIYGNFDITKINNKLKNYITNIKF
jgi:hypothetical protein